jgi:ketosteroid isomerase-like protein
VPPTASATETSVDLVTRFENNFNTYDVDALMADMTDDCVFEHPLPGPPVRVRRHLRRRRPLRLSLDHALAAAGGW